VAEVVLVVSGLAGAREVTRELERIMYELGRAAAHGSSANLKKWIMIQKDFQLIASVLPREREHAQTPDAN